MTDRERKAYAWAGIALWLLSVCGGVWAAFGETIGGTR